MRSSGLNVGEARGAVRRQQGVNGLADRGDRVGGVGPHAGAAEVGHLLARGGGVVDVGGRPPDVQVGGIDERGRVGDLQLEGRRVDLGSNLVKAIPRLGAFSMTRRRAARPRPSCGPARMIVSTGTNDERYSTSAVCSVAYSLSIARGTECTRCSGTKTFSAIMVLLPVPFIPATNHVSLIVSSLMGMKASP
jgi:hypothetical protein